MTRKLALLVAAGGLIVLGRRVPWARALSASLAATLAARAWPGQRHARELVSTRRAQETAVDQTVEASFPASDAPAHTATAGAVLA